MDTADILQTGASPFTAQSIYPADTGAADPALAKEFLGIHRASMEKRAPEIDAVMGSMDSSIASMTKMLDDTTAAIKASRDNRTNVPLMAMAAGLLSSKGNFGQALGQGFGQMVPAILAQRKEDENLDFQLGQLQLRKAMVQQAPLDQKLAYLKALQVGDQATVRAIEQALIRSKGGVDRLANEQQKLQTRAVQDSLAEARKAVEVESKEMYATAEERAAAIKQRFIENIKIHKANGLQIPDNVIAEVTGAIGGGGAPGVATPMKTRASYFEAPTSPEAVQKTVEAGLPPPPSGYIYESIGPKDRPKHMAEETKNFQKESKAWDDESAVQRSSMDKIDQIEKILTRNPKVVGLQRGVIPNNWTLNMSEDAQTLKSLFTGIQLNDVPKGQGAVSNLERDLFALASPNMAISAEANKNLLAIQKEIIKRDADRRAFFGEYFNNYRTTDGMVQAWDRYINSPAGSAFIRDDSGNPIANKSRQNWRDFFRSERGAEGPAQPLKRAKGGYIRLDETWD